MSFPFTVRWAAEATALRAQLPDFDHPPPDPDEFVFRPIYWQLPIALAVGLVVTLLLLYLVGRALSAADLRKTAGAPAAPEKTNRLYSTVLWFAVVAFYAWFPVIVGFAALFALGISALAIGLAMNLRFISLKIIIGIGAIVVMSLLGLLGVITGFFLERQKHGVRRRITAEEAPELFAAIAEAAKAAGSRMADDVFLRADTSISVHEEGGTLKVLTGKGHRVLELGIAGMRGFTVSQLKAVLGPEFGHFAGGDTRVSPVIAGVVGRLTTIHANYQSLGAIGTFNPVYWYVSGYLSVFHSIAAGLSRRRELVADHVAASAFGGEALAEALRRSDISGLLFAKYCFPIIGQFRRSGRSFTHLEGALTAVERAFAPGVRERLAEAAAARPMDPHDSHPPVQQRIAAVRTISSQQPTDRREWTVLFPGYDKVVSEITAHVVKLVDAELEEANALPAQHVALTREQESKLAAAFGVMADAYQSLDETRPEEAAAVLQDAIRRLAEASSDDDTVLIAPMLDVARLKARAGKPDESAALVARAIQIARTHHGTQALLLELGGMLREFQGMAGMKIEEESPPVVQAAPVVERAEETPPAVSEAPREKRRGSCPACKSVVDLNDVEARGSCNWCGAPWAA